MATFNIATAKNIDELTSKAGSDTYNILDGGYLTVDQDSRYGLNNTTSTAMGAITMAAGGVGTVEFNATKVRLIPYDTGTGNVPAYNTAIVQGSATGKLIAVYDTLTSAPTAVGAGMPANGWIKIKQWNDVAYAAGALTNIGANATAADFAGWIEVVGVDAIDCTVNRLNTFKVRGEWYELGTTDGNRATTYQIPTNGSSTLYLPGVWVETAASSGIYEFYPSAAPASALLANVGTESTRGKFCWISLSGVLKFGNDGTNSTGGYIPANNLKIRIPNIFFVNCTSGALTVNSIPHATLTTRYSFVTTGGGVIDMDKCCMNWWPYFLQPYSVTLSYVAFMTQLSVAEIASPLTWSQVGIGQETPANGQFGLVMVTCLAGGTMDKCTWTSATLAASGRYVTSLTDIDGFTITNERICALAARGNNTTGASIQTRVSNSTWTDTTVGLGRIFMTTNSDVTYTNTTYYDCVAATTLTGSPMNIFDLGTKSSNIKIDTITFPIPLTQPYSGVLNVGATACTGVKLRNLGTYASPLDMGGAQQDGVSWSRASTTATVTKTAHGLKTGDYVYVLVSSNTACITVGSKALTGAPTADTFTFTCLASGTSGTLTYYPTMTGVLFSASVAANNIEVKRCYVPHLRTNLYTSDNSVKNLTLKNVRGDYINAPLATAGPVLDLTYQGIHATPAQTAQVSDYGTIWFDGFIQETKTPASGRAWTRSSTTATVTDATDHNLRTGMQIVVTVTSSAAAIILGTKTVTATTKDAFTFTCINAGDASGTLTYETVSGRIGLMMNEKTTATTAHYTTTGTPSFTSAGTLFFITAGDKVVWETPDYIIGHTSFVKAEPVILAATSAKKNWNVKYYIDKNDGNGYSAAKNLSFVRWGGGGSNGSTDVTMTDTTGVAVNDYIFGTNIAPLAQVQSITNGTTVVSTLANTGTVSGVLLFNQIPNETVDAEDGFKLKISLEALKGTADATWTRSTTTATCTYNNHGLSVSDVFYVTISSSEAAITVASKAVAAVTDENVFTFTCLNAGDGSGTLTYTYPVITSYHLLTDSTETSRAFMYPLDTANVTLTGLQANSEVRAYVGTDPSTAVAVGGVEDSGTSFTFSQSSSGSDGYIIIHALGYLSTKLDITYSGSDITIPVQQTIDRQYLNPA